VSRIGFRIFLTIIGSLLAALVFINLHYVYLKQSNDVSRDTVARSLSALDGVISSAVVTDLDNSHVEVPGVRLQHNRTKVLVWTDDDGQFFAQLSKQIIYLRTTPRNGCASLTQCAFSSDKWKLPRADAVIVAAKNTSTLLHLPIFESVISTDIGSKLWTLLLKDPSYHEAFLNSLSNPNKFDFLVSYLPNSTFPLVKVHFEAKSQEAGIFVSLPTSSTSHEKHLNLNLPKPRYHHFHQHKVPEKDVFSLKRSKRESDTENKRIVATIIVI